MLSRAVHRLRERRTVHDKCIYYIFLLFLFSSFPFCLCCSAKQIRSFRHFALNCVRVFSLYSLRSREAWNKCRLRPPTACLTLGEASTSTTMRTKVGAKNFRIVACAAHYFLFYKILRRDKDKHPYSTGHIRPSTVKGIIEIIARVETHTHTTNRLCIEHYANVLIINGFGRSFHSNRYCDCALRFSVRLPSASWRTVTPKSKTNHSNELTAVRFSFSKYGVKFNQTSI